MAVGRRKGTSASFAARLAQHPARAHLHVCNGGVDLLLSRQLLAAARVHQRTCTVGEEEARDRARCRAAKGGRLPAAGCLATLLRRPAPPTRPRLLVTQVSRPKGAAARRALCLATSNGATVQLGTHLYRSPHCMPTQRSWLAERRHLSWVLRRGFLGLGTAMLVLLRGSRRLRAGRSWAPVPADVLQPQLGLPSRLPAAPAPAGRLLGGGPYSGSAAW